MDTVRNIPTPANAELFRALGVLAEAPGRQHRAIARALQLSPPQSDEEWQAAFTEALVLRACPYASICLNTEGMLGGNARDRIAGFWRAVGLTPPDEPDHLPVLLAAYARLVEHCARDPRWHNARQALLNEHLLSWLPPWLDRIENWGPPFYADWATLLRQALKLEVGVVGQTSRLPAHLRTIPAMRDPRDDTLDAFVGDLLAPAVSGIILFREDIQCAARELGEGCRLGERRFMLRTLMQQSPAACFNWLARYASASARSHLQTTELHEEVARHWTARAKRTQRLLADLALDVRGALPILAQASCGDPQPPMDTARDIQNRR